MIAITARPARGFWRANVFHPPERVFHKDDAFTQAQFDELMDEPELIVEEDVYDPAEYVNYTRRLSSRDPLPDRRSGEDRRTEASGLSRDGMQSHRHTLGDGRVEPGSGNASGPGEKEKGGWFSRKSDDVKTESDASAGAKDGAGGDDSKSTADQK